MATYTDVDFNMPDIEVGIWFFERAQAFIDNHLTGFVKIMQNNMRKIDQFESTMKTWAIIRRMHLLKSCLMYYILTRK